MACDSAVAVSLSVEINGGCIKRLIGNRSGSGLVGVCEVERDEQRHHTHHERSKNAQSDMTNDHDHRIPFAL